MPPGRQTSRTAATAAARRAAAKRRPVEHDTSFKAYLDRCPEPTTFGALKMGTLESGPEAEPAEEATAYAPPLAGTNAN